MGTLLFIGKVLGYAALGAIAIWLLQLYFQFEWLKNLLDSWFKS